MSEPNWEQDRAKAPRNRWRTIGMVAGGLVLVALAVRTLSPQQEPEEAEPRELEVTQETAPPSPSPSPSPTIEPRPSARPEPAAEPEQARGEWQVAPSAPVRARANPALAWTGTEALLFGGTITVEDGSRQEFPADGAAYDPAAEEWRALPAAPLEPRTDAAVMWTGSELLVWGGSGRTAVLNDGAAYNPATGSWRALAPAPLQPRQGVDALWTGEEVLFIGGRDLAGAFSDGAAYNPESDTWRTLAPAPAPPIAVWGGSVPAVWTGSRAVFQTTPLADGAQPSRPPETLPLAYDPATDTWELLPSLGRDAVGLTFAEDGEDLLTFTLDYGGGGQRVYVDRLAPGSDAWARESTSPQLDPNGGPPLAAYDPGTRRVWLLSTTTRENAATLAFDIATGVWSALPPRPAVPEEGGRPLMPLFGPELLVAGDGLLVWEWSGDEGSVLERWVPDDSAPDDRAGLTPA